MASQWQAGKANKSSAIVSLYSGHVALTSSEKMCAPREYRSQRALHASGIPRDTRLAHKDDTQAQAFFTQALWSRTDPSNLKLLMRALCVKGKLGMGTNLLAL